MSEERKTEEVSSIAAESKVGLFSRFFQNSAARKAVSIGGAMGAATAGFVATTQGVGAVNLSDANGVTPQDYQSEWGKTEIHADYKAPAGTVMQEGNTVIVSSSSPNPEQVKNAIVVEAQAKLDPNFKTVIGVTNEDDLKALGIKLSVKNTPDGSKVYTYASESALRPNELIVKNGKVILERIVLPENPSSPAYRKLSDLANLGNKTVKVPGSKFYGVAVNYYLNLDIGEAHIGNPNTNEVFEMNQFVSGTTQDQLNSETDNDIGLVVTIGEGGPQSGLKPQINPAAPSPSQPAVSEGNASKGKDLSSIETGQVYGDGFSILYNRDTHQFDIMIKNETSFNKFMQDKGFSLSDLSIHSIKHLSTVSPTPAKK